LLNITVTDGREGAVDAEVKNRIAGSARRPAQPDHLALNHLLTEFDDDALVPEPSVETGSSIVVPHNDVVQVAGVRLVEDIVLVVDHDTATRCDDRRTERRRLRRPRDEDQDRLFED
jgi:hypothetical protein